MDFILSPAIEGYRRRVRAFVEVHILPLEADPGGGFAPTMISMRAEKRGNRDVITSHK